MPDENHLIDLLRGATAGRREDVFALLPDGREITFAALYRGAERIAAALTAEGMRPGDRVAAQVAKTIEAIELYLGTVMAGGVFLPLNTAYTGPEVAYFLGDAAPAVVVCDPARAGEIAAVAGAARVLTLDRDGSGSLRDLADRQDGFAPVPHGPDDLRRFSTPPAPPGAPRGRC